MVLRVTRQIVNVLGKGSSAKLRVTQQYVEVLSKIDTGTDVSASSGLAFTQSSSLEFAAATSQSLIFGHTNDVIGPLTKSVGPQSLNFTQSSSAAPSFAHSASGSFSFSHSVGVTPTFEYAESSLIFSDSASVPTSLSASDSVIFSQNAFGNEASFVQTVNFSQSTSVGKIIPGGIDSSASNNLIFTDTTFGVHVLATATSHSGSDSLVFRQWAGFPLADQGVTHVLSFTHSIDPGFIQLVEHEIIFSHPDPTYTAVWPEAAANGLIFKHAFMFENLEGDTCYYDPILVESSDPDAPQQLSPTAPTLVKYDNIKLYYPTTTPTLAIEVRAPRMGDRDRILNNRVQRESRGGTLQVFADPTWPKVQTLVLSFTGLTETIAEQLQSFFLSTLGLTVGLRDWEGRVWHGVIVNPDEPFIRARRDIIDMSFEFDGELQ